MNRQNIIQEQLASQSVGAVDWGGIIWYLLGAFGISWTLIIGLRPVTSQAETIGMFGPALACLLVRLLRREGFAGTGLRPASPGEKSAWRWYATAYAVPVTILGVSIGTSFFLGIQHWILPETARQLEVSTLQLTGILLLLPVVIVGLVMLPTFGEELGWRGYLLPRLLPLGETKATLISGFIWGLWHIPTILLNNHGFGAANPWLSIPMFVLVIMLYGIFLSWLRLRSGSIWPSVLAHAVINTSVSFLFASFSVGNRYLETPIGLMTLIPFAAFDLWLLLTGRLHGKRDSRRITGGKL